jgi:DegT/DnrJ/EryC1/StrS aminotransferase family
LQTSYAESEFASYTGHKYCVGLNSCGSAIFLALWAAGVRDGDTVLSNALTFNAVPSAIHHARAKGAMLTWSVCAAAAMCLCLCAAAAIRLPCRRRPVAKMLLGQLRQLCRPSIPAPAPPPGIPRGWPSLSINTSFSPYCALFQYSSPSDARRAQVC